MEINVKSKKQANKKENKKAAAIAAAATTTSAINKIQKLKLICSKMS